MQTVIGHAKINLCLAVVGRRGEKHLIDSVFCPAPVKDVLRLEKANGVTVTYSDGRSYPRDTAFLAAKAICDKYGLPGVKVVVEKGIPEGAGLGGSSADAGAVARGMEKLFGLPPVDEILLSSIGGDVPYFARGGYARVRGVGEKVERIDLPLFYVVVLVPDVGVNTGECYRLYDVLGGETGDVDEFLKEFRQGTCRPFNALQRAGEKLCPAVTEGIKVLTEAGFACGMTGSGSATFGVETDKRAFREKKERLYENIKGFRLYADEEE